MNELINITAFTLKQRAEVGPMKRKLSVVTNTVAKAICLKDVVFVISSELVTIISVDNLSLLLTDS